MTSLIIYPEPHTLYYVVLLTTTTYYFLRRKLDNFFVTKFVHLILVLMNLLEQVVKLYSTVLRQSKSKSK